MLGSRNEDQTLRSSQCGQYPAGMIGWRVGIGRSVDQQHGNLDRRSRQHGAYGINFKAPLLLRKLEGSRDDGPREEEWRSLGRHGAKVGKCFCRDHCRHPRIQRGFLYRNRGPEGRSNEDDRARADCVQHTVKIALLEESVCAGVPR